MQQGKYIILRESNLVDLSDPFSGRSFALRRNFPAEGLGLTVDLESDLTSRDIADLHRDPQVVNIAPSMPVHLIEPVATEAADTGEETEATWGVIATGANQSPYTGKGITVAVLDTGIDANHEAFKGVQVVEKDFTGEGNGDQNGHGTHCAGTIFGQVVDGLRFGVAPGIEKAVIGKVLSAQGGSTEQIYQAILWAIDQGAHIISMSLGMDFPGLVKQLVERRNFPADFATSMALESYRANLRLFENLAALIRARSPFFQPTLLIAAAGNESKRQINKEYELAVAPPAAADGIISVGALQTSGVPHDSLSIANFSNTGPNISGPGVGVYSAKTGGGYVKFSGTSMATPHVAGIAALWGEKLKQISPTGNFNGAELSARLIGNATRKKLAPDVEPMDVGAGLVQAPL
ncbi:MAG: S8 family serine peptidase [Nostocaceae cyanobacterium]|nr:S8 family serine peptidase [Nostocaceae cyanobacterium]